MGKNFHVYKQYDIMDCGPACLCMIAEYYGKTYCIETMRNNAFLGKHGVSLLGISKAAESIGLKTIGGRLTFDTLTHKVSLPCIVHWKQEHFIVVYRITKNQKGYKIHIADPAIGLLEYTQEEFFRYWLTTKTNGEEKGVALLLEPTASFYNYKDDHITTKNRFSFL